MMKSSQSLVDWSKLCQCFVSNCQKMVIFNTLRHYKISPKLALSLMCLIGLFTLYVLYYVVFPLFTDNGAATHDLGESSVHSVMGRQGQSNQGNVHNAERP